MYGQLNLFAFKPKVKVFYPTPIKLRDRLRELVEKTDRSGYSFSKFDYEQDAHIKNANYHCLTVVIYQKNPIGFVSLSLDLIDWKSHLPPVSKAPGSIDVWVMPRYRDMGFGSILVNRANKESLERCGQLPNGSDKHHLWCWDARFRLPCAEYYNNKSHESQLLLFEEDEYMFWCNKLVAKYARQLAVDNSIDAALMRRVLQG